MGIRYYAYAFDENQADRALADPRAFIGEDPLADAWGFTPNASVAGATFEQAVPESDLLYLDKAWRELQLLTGTPGGRGTPRPAYRMFEGHVTEVENGWHAWVRGLAPAEVVDIAGDLAVLRDEEAVARLRALGMTDGDVSYALTFLRRARKFVERLAADGRGMAYMIG